MLRSNGTTRHPEIRPRLFLSREDPAHAAGDRWFVVFPLNNILRATVVEAEYLIIQVQSVGKQSQASVNPDASLGVYLKVRVKIIVPTRSPDTSCW